MKNLIMGYSLNCKHENNYLALVMQVFNFSVIVVFFLYSVTFIIIKKVFSMVKGLGVRTWNSQRMWFELSQSYDVWE